jgi:hypothetical protein
MKKKLLFLCLAIAAIEMQSQNAIPNAGFENWTINSIENPMYYPFTSNENCYKQGNPSNVKKATPAFHGLYALELKTLSNNLAFMMNADSKGGNTSLWTNGMAYTDRPTGIKGRYKYNQALVDSALMFVLLRKNKTTIGTYQYKLGGIKTDYTVFDFTFTPALTQDPDSLIFALASSDFYKNQSGVTGSTLIIDSVSLKGVSSQPAQFNGDYELWDQIVFPPMLNDWNLQSKSSGIERSTEAKTGQYALKLTTYLGEENNVPRAMPGYLTSGYWDSNCICIQGGNPYTLTKDTLAFWYKYAPQGNDWATVSIQFIKNGSQIHGEHKTLSASQNYQYIEVPFNLGDAPSHVIVQAISSDWHNTNTSYIGSTLILDNMFFKSSIDYSNLKSIEAYPQLGLWFNENAKTLNVSPVNVIMECVDIFDISGKKVFSEVKPNTKLNINNLANGIYFVKINAFNKNYNFKVLKF